MNKAIYLIVAFFLILCSCKKDSDESAEAYLSRISANLAQNNVDSLKQIRNDLSQNETDEVRSKLFCLTADSSLRLRAMTLILSQSPENVADTLLAYPSVEFAKEIYNSYTLLNIKEDYKKTTIAAQHKFDALSPDRQALIIVAYMSPEKAGAAMEPGDEKLIKAMQKEYASNPDDLHKFNNFLQFQPETK